MMPEQQLPIVAEEPKPLTREELERLENLYAKTNNSLPSPQREQLREMRSHDGEAMEKQ